ncbi:RNA-dependent RNA polymerase [Phytophthora cinnamomi ormycovirus 9-16]|uniref:RNA-dependent RNA polymerase n=1 Tax=Phytophthora cinnamomi ormycovirus 9-16 TaxID=3239327 RepID=A0AB39J7Q1_9VIRU
MNGASPKLQKFNGWVNVGQEFVAFPHPEQKRIERSLSSCWNLENWEIPKLKDRYFERVLQCFKAKLLFWEKVSAGRDVFLAPIEIARKSIYFGPAVAGELDDMVSFSLRERVMDLTYEDVILESDSNAWGHDYFFPARDLLPWRLPEKKEDIMRLTAEPPDIPAPFIKKFKDEAENYIKRGVERPFLDDIDKLSLFKNSSVFNWEKKKSFTNYASRVGKKIRGTSQLKYKYAWVQKNSCEARSCLVGTPETLYEIKDFHKMFKAIADCPEDLFYAKDVTVGLEEWLTPNKWDNAKFIMSDIKKSGLTYNRHLHDALMEVLHSIYPTWGWDKWIGYKDACFYDPSSDKTFRITNGYGLGMLDCVISFSQAVIYNIWKEEILQDASFDLEGKFWSDDSIVKITSKIMPFEHDHLIEMSRSFNKHLSNYGIVVHDKKPYYSKKGCFLETYGTTYGRNAWDHSKVSQYIGCLYDTLKAPTIFRAKEMFSALMLLMPECLSDWASLALYDITSFWGYEFFEGEADVPFECGGWTFVVSEGINTLLKTVQDLPDRQVYDASVRMMNCPGRRPRYLPLHKANREWIDGLIEIGSEIDLSPFSWRKAARSSLLLDYKANKDVVRIEEGILKARQRHWKASMASHEPIMLEIYNFWDNHRTEGWYLPPLFATKDCSGLSVLIEFPSEKKSTLMNLPERGRAWHYLLSSLGLEDVEVSDPHYTYAGTLDTYFDLMKGLAPSGDDYAHIKCSFMWGYDPERLREALMENYACDLTLKDPRIETDSIFDKVYELVMGEKHKEFVYPLPGTPVMYGSSLHRYSPILWYANSKKVERVIPYAYERLAASGLEKDYCLVQDVALDIQEYIGDKIRIDDVSETSDLRSDDSDYAELPEAAKQHLEYLKVMIRETMSVSTQFQDPEMRGSNPLTSQYASAFDDDDGCEGMGLGFDEDY